MIVTFEGLDGSGKSTLAQAFIQWMASTDIQGCLVSDFYDTVYSRTVTSLFLTPDNDTQTVDEILLVTAARVYNFRTRAKPVLDAGGVVVYDRYIDSTYAMQGYAVSKAALDIHLGVQNAVSDSLGVPDITFYLDASDEIRLERLDQTGKHFDAMELRDQEYHQKVRAGFEHLVSTNPQRMYVLDASLPVHKLLDEVIRVFRERKETDT